MQQTTLNYPNFTDNISIVSASFTGEFVQLIITARVKQKKKKKSGRFVQ